MTATNRIQTQADTGAKFHWLFLGEQPLSPAIYNTLIEETENFAVLPTKGSIVPGWVLVVPKFPVPRIADVPMAMRNELEDLVSRISAELAVKFGSTFAFEHGGLKGSPIACGVDQAHLHIVPLGFDLVEAAEVESPSGWVNVGSDLVPPVDLSDFEYWFVSSGKISLMKTICCARSQFFRKVIAQKVGKPDLWDYRKVDFIENVAITLKAIGQNG